MTARRRGPDIAAAAELLRSRSVCDPDAVVVLGSGLAGAVGDVKDPIVVPFADLPGFPRAGVAGHEGRYVWGRLADRNVLVQAGRYHMYEGHPETVVAAPVRLAAALGARVLILTNASGGVAPDIEAGDVVLIADHLNLMARNPLVGPVIGSEQRFPDMSAPWDPELQRLALEAAGQLGMGLRRGTYAGLLGPSYETAAEVRMARRMGADVVGMSTVPEVIAARSLGLRCLGLSVVANKAVGLTSAPLRHEEVVEAVGRAAGRVGRLLAAVLEAIPQSVEAK